MAGREKEKNASIASIRRMEETKLNITANSVSLPVESLKDKLYWYRGIITNVVDGDTLDIEILLGFGAKLKLRLRLNRINAPEVRGKERDQGIKSTHWITNKLLNEEVIIHTEKGDAFGRWLAEVYLDNICINDEMVSLGYASYKEY